MALIVGCRRRAAVEGLPERSLQATHPAAVNSSLNCVAMDALQLKSDQTCNDERCCSVNLQLLPMACMSEMHLFAVLTAHLLRSLSSGSVKPQGGSAAGRVSGTTVQDPGTAERRVSSQQRCRNPMDPQRASWAATALQVVPWQWWSRSVH
jgi:hypothetical protein